MVMAKHVNQIADTLLATFVTLDNCSGFSHGTSPPFFLVYSDCANNDAKLVELKNGETYNGEAHLVYV